MSTYANQYAQDNALSEADMDELTWQTGPAHPRMLAGYHVNGVSYLDLDAALDQVEDLLARDMEVTITPCTDPDCEPCYQEWADHQG